jgi:hypothetical protein
MHVDLNSGWAMGGWQSSWGGCEGWKEQYPVLEILPTCPGASTGNPGSHL